MVGDVTEGIAKDASLGDRPVAGKSGTSENFFDAWFIGFTPELVTGTCMGYAEGGQTLEYVLDYARKLHGLSGGITPAEIWKRYTKVILSGESIEQFDGVKIPESTDPAADPKPRVKNVPHAARGRASASPGAQGPAPEPRWVAAASASASSVSHREPECPGPSAPEPPVTAPHLPALAQPQDRLRWHGDVFVTVDQITPRKVGPACYAEPGGLDDTLGRRASVRDGQAT
jgi:membrane peptidoglycan carboxypeptidase